MRDPNQLFRGDGRRPARYGGGRIGRLLDDDKWNLYLSPHWVSGGRSYRDYQLGRWWQQRAACAGLLRVRSTHDLPAIPFSGRLAGGGWFLWLCVVPDQRWVWRIERNRWCPKWRPNWFRWHVVRGHFGHRRHALVRRNVGIRRKFDRRRHDR